MAVLARSAASLPPARPEDGGSSTFCSRSVPSPPKEWRPRHVLRLFCSLPTQRMVAPAHYAASLLPACPEDGGPGTFCSPSAPCPKNGGPGTFRGPSAPCLPGGWRTWHVLQPFCSLPPRGGRPQHVPATVLLTTCPLAPPPTFPQFSYVLTDSQFRGQTAENTPSVLEIGHF